MRETFISAKCYLSVYGVFVKRYTPPGKFYIVLISPLYILKNKKRKQIKIWIKFSEIDKFKILLRFGTEHAYIRLTDKHRT